MMKTFHVLAIWGLMLGAEKASAFELPSATNVSLQQFVDSPRTFRDQSIRLSQLQCVDDKTFVCVTIHDGRALRIKASSLGAGTSQSIAEDLIGGCKGTANIDRPKCRFDIIIKPIAVADEMMSSEKGTMRLIEVHSNQIEFVRRKPR